MKTFPISKIAPKFNHIITYDLPCKITRGGETVAVILDIDQYIDLTGSEPDDISKRSIQSILSTQHIHDSTLSDLGDEIDVEDSDGDDMDQGGERGQEATLRHESEPSATPPGGGRVENSNTSPPPLPSNLSIQAPLAKDLDNDLKKLRELKEMKLNLL